MGDSGTGLFLQTGGTNSCGYLSVGNGTSGIGSYSLSGGSLATASNASIGYSGTGTFTQIGGTNSVGYWLNIGNQAGSAGAYNLSGSGYLTVASIENVGLSGMGSFTQSGGTNSCSSLILGGNIGGSGTYNLSGGLTVLSSLGRGSGAAAFNFSGGTLRASSAFSSNLPMTLGTSGGGSTFDTAGYSISLSGSLSGPGSLTMNDSLGTGILILTASNTYTGGTTISAGTLQLGTGQSGQDGSIDATSSVAIDAGAALAFDLAGTDTAGYPIGGNGALATFGSGRLVLSGTNNYQGGTTINGGTLILTNSEAIADGTSLTVGDPSLFAALAVPSLALSSGIAPVPEPGTLALFSAAVCSAAIYQRLRPRRERQ